MNPTTMESVDRSHRNSATTRIASPRAGWQRIDVAVPAAFEVEPGSPGSDGGRIKDSPPSRVSFRTYHADAVYYLDADLDTLHKHVTPSTWKSTERRQASLPIYGHAMCRG
jgi:hypothetical protein